MPPGRAITTFLILSIKGVLMRAAISTTVEVAGIALITFGVFFIWGVGWACVFAGAAVVAISVLRAVR